MTYIHSFNPISAANATRLVLGTMPGKASLAANEYYAHPRNAFWQIVETVLEIPAALPYPERCARVVEQKLAVWDVLKTCTRSSSLDSDIVEASLVPNEFNAFFAAHPRIHTVFFNGVASEKIYLKHILPYLPDGLRKLRLVRLPSTSPAHAGMPFTEKVRRWRIIRDGV